MYMSKLNLDYRDHNLIHYSTLFLKRFFLLIKRPFVATNINENKIKN